MLQLLGKLDIGDFVSLILFLFAILLIIHYRSKKVIDPETKKFIQGLIMSEKDKLWALIIVVLFMYAIFHVGPTSPLVETFKTLVAGAVGWIGNMLTSANKVKPDEPAPTKPPEPHTEKPNGTTS